MSIFLLSISETQVNKNADKLSKLPLCDRLDEYYEDPDLLKGKPNLSAFPPSFEPLPCKPLFFDLAREQLAFPNLEHKMVSAAAKDKKDAGQQQGQGGSGGWLGGWLGGWGGGNQKK